MGQTEGSSSGPQGGFASEGRIEQVRGLIGVARVGGAAYAWRRVRNRRQRPKVTPGPRDAVYRRIWQEAAAELGAELVDLSNGLLEARREGSAANVRQQLTPLDGAVALRLALDKPRVHALMSSEKLPVPEHLEVPARERGPALAFLDLAASPCVVKPARGTAGGDGTTAGVHRPHEYALARLRAARYDRRILIERQAEGAVYRLLFLDGELLDVVRSVPPRVTGDGRSSIEGLIAAENERRRAAGGFAGLSPLGLGLDTVFTLRRFDLRLSSVLAAGTTVAVQTVTNDNAPEDSTTVREPLAPSLVGDARKATAAVGLRLAGVDVITLDPFRPLSETGGVITEVNGTPGIHHHYLVADPARATRVGVPILERMLAEAPRLGHGPTRDQELLR